MPTRNELVAMAERCGPVFAVSAGNGSRAFVVLADGSDARAALEGKNFGAHLPERHAVLAFRE